MALLSLLFLLFFTSTASLRTPWPHFNQDVFHPPPDSFEIQTLPLPRHHQNSFLQTNSYPNYPFELFALSSLYDSLNGQSWSWSSNASMGQIWDFNSSQPCADQWQRITCVCVPAYGLCFVVKLDLSDLNLNGTIPAEIQYLPQLAYLNLANNTLLRGVIPSEIGLLTNLQYLSMYVTHVIGTLPNELRNLKSLRYLIAGQVINFNRVISRSNGISGEYPVILASLPNLQYLYLYGTQHFGPIPSVWSTMTQLNALVLGGSFLNGTIPSSIFSLTNLIYFVVGDSHLSGSIPSTIGNLVNCKVMSFNRNFFTSTIPTTISELTSLEYLYLYRNSFLPGHFPLALTLLPRLKYLELSQSQLTGPLPATISRMTSLILLSLELNHLTSSIPSEIGSLILLQFLDISQNTLSRNFPTSFGHLASLQVLNATGNSFTGPLDFFESLTQLRSLDLSSNSFVGSFPFALSKYASLEYFQLGDNQMTGTIPPWFGELTTLICLDLSHNQLMGSIPSELTNLTNLVYFDISSNPMSSSIPEEIVRLSSLQLLVIDQCGLTGYIPQHIGVMTSLRSLRLKKNQLVGPIPNSIGSLGMLQLLDLSYNSLSGSLPSTINQLHGLNSLLLHNNRLYGTINSLVDFKSQTRILTIDINDNAFTGTLPLDLFLLPSLIHFAAAVNCLHGSMQHFICQAHRLQVLVLDGVGAANICKRDSSDSRTHGLDGTLPPCLFEMLSLKTLHVSGNKITGTLPSDLKASSKLQDVSLSHNLLTGPIPLTLQHREWTSLDLSFNRFYGSLSSKFAVYSQASSLRLLVNRLSGKVPLNVQSAYNVSVLDGNLFQCNVYNREEGLPRHDSATGAYQCADSFEQLSYTWMSPFLLCVFLAVAGLCLFTIWKSWSVKVYSFAEKIDRYMAILDKPLGSGRTSSILLFKKFVVDWLVTCLFISACNIFIILPVWVVLTINYNTYQYEYSWSASVAYLSGLVPAVVALLMFTFLLATVFSLTTTNSARHQSRRTSNFVAVEIPESFLSWMIHYVALCAFTFFNCIIVIGVNVLYVIATNTLNKTVVMLCAIAVAFFKAGWRSIIFFIFELIERDLAKSKPIHIFGKFQERNLIAQSVIGLINSTLIPLLSTAAVSSTCFYYYIWSAKPIVASFQYSECVIQTVLVYGCQVLESVVVCHNVEGVSYQCLGENPVERSTSFSPPFSYSYQCSSTFIASYSAVYVYSYMMVAVSPLIIFLLHRAKRLFSPQHTFLHRSINSILPKYLVPEAEDERSLFNKNLFITYAITDTAVLITFGGIFPPLSFVICVSIMIRAFWILSALGKLLADAEDGSIPEYSQRMLHDCAGVPEIFGKLLWLILPFASIIYSLFILDTYGDAVSWKKAWIPTVVMWTIPFLFLALGRIYKHPSVKPLADDFFDWCRKNIPLLKVLLKSRPQDLGLRATVIVSQSARLSTVAFRKVGVGVTPHTTPRVDDSNRPASSVVPSDIENMNKVTPFMNEKEDDQRPVMSVVPKDLSVEDL
jgi:Leucine-rich repeat (LRR) protein